MSGKLLVYGANGYTGRLVVDVARARGFQAADLIVAGRNGEVIQALGDAAGLEYRVFGLDSPSTVDACLEGVTAVLHCAGPFARTATPMAEACIRMGVHYLDVTGEVGVFEKLAARTDEATRAGVMLMPGVGFDVVPSDCLAVHVAARVKDPTTLRIAILGLGASMSHGTAMTMVENLHRGGLVRREGKLVKVRSGSVTRMFDFGRGPKLAMAVPWGDLSTAWHSTGIGTIETYFAASNRMVWGARAAGFMPWLIGSGAVQNLMKKRVHARPAGPTEEERKASRSVLVAEVENTAGQGATSRLTTPNGYALTADVSVEIARRVLGGEVRAGFQTPAMVYGADFVMTLAGTEREDLAV